LRDNLVAVVWAIQHDFERLDEPVMWIVEWPMARTHLTLPKGASSRVLLRDLDYRIAWISGGFDRHFASKRPRTSLRLAGKMAAKAAEIKRSSKRPKAFYTRHQAALAGLQSDNSGHL